jgi:HK97 family phage portal protein
LQLEREYALYGEIYKSQPWVRTVIDKRANAVARLPVDCWDVNGETRTLDTRSRYAALLANPCEYMDNASFWFWIQANLDIYGEAYLAIVKDDNDLPVSFMPMHPSRVAIQRDPDSGVYHYTFQAGSGLGTGLVKFPQSDVVPFKLFNPNKLERGLSRMDSLKSTIFAEDSSRNATSAMWQHAGRPNMVLTSEKPLGPQGRQRLADSFRMAHAGSSNAGKALVLEDGVTAASFQLTAVEMQHIESRQLNREEVCGVYDIAPPIVHILDNATYSNISAQMRAFYRDTMAPALIFIESVMDKYVGAYWTRKNTMKFAVDDVIRGDFESRATAGQSAVTTGGITPNEYRELMGYNKSDDPKADKLYANSALQPLGEPAEQIRLQGQIEGGTPDGVTASALPTPGTTPVASLDNSKPTSVPALQAKPPAGKPAGQAPSKQPPKPIGPPNPVHPNAAPKHLRAIKGALGRQQDINEVAQKLYNAYPDEWEDILLSVAIAAEEHSRKANN